MVMRQRVWIDNHVQGVLVGRVFLYWSGIIIYFVMSIGGYQAWQNPEWTFGEHLSAMIEQLWPCLTTMFLILPLVVFDIVRLSHKFAGPIYRLRNHLDQLNENPQTYPLNFRDDDYWQQLADPINQLQHKLLECEQKLQAMTLVNKGLMTGNLAQLVGNVGNPSATTPEKPTANPATSATATSTPATSTPATSATSATATSAPATSATPKSAPVVPASTVAVQPAADEATNTSASDSTESVDSDDIEQILAAQRASSAQKAAASTNKLAKDDVAPSATQPDISSAMADMPKIESFVTVAAGS